MLEILKLCLPVPITWRLACLGKNLQVLSQAGPPRLSKELHMRRLRVSHRAQPFLFSEGKI